MSIVFGIRLALRAMAGGGVASAESGSGAPDVAGVIAWEEHYLERKFGDAYRASKARVRRWV